MPDDDRNKYGVSFAFAYIIIIEVKLVLFHRYKKLFDFFNF